jgi:hypothetical protein
MAIWIAPPPCRPNLLAIPIVNQAGMRESLRTYGPRQHNHSDLGRSRGSQNA